MARAVALPRRHGAAGFANGEKNVPALADLPVHCLHSQIAGEWTFHLGAVAPAHHSVPNCSVAFDHVHTVKMELGNVVGKPASAVVTEASTGAPVSVGQEGAWTTIYDEGFDNRL